MKKRGLVKVIWKIDGLNYLISGYQTFTKNHIDENPLRQKLDFWAKKKRPV
jgi:hypothetical protein